MRAEDSVSGQCECECSRRNNVCGPGRFFTLKGWELSDQGNALGL